MKFRYIGRSFLYYMIIKRNNMWERNCVRIRVAVESARKLARYIAQYSIYRASFAIFLCGADYSIRSNAKLVGARARAHEHVGEGACKFHAINFILLPGNSKLLTGDNSLREAQREIGVIAHLYIVH